MVIIEGKRNHNSLWNIPLGKRNNKTHKHGKSQKINNGKRYNFPGPNQEIIDRMSVSGLF